MTPSGCLSGYFTHWGPGCPPLSVVGCHQRTLSTQRQGMRAAATCYLPASREARPRTVEETCVHACTDALPTGWGAWIMQLTPGWCAQVVLSIETFSALQSKVCCSHPAKPPASIAQPTGMAGLQAGGAAGCKRLLWGRHVHRIRSADRSGHLQVSAGRCAHACCALLAPKAQAY